MKQPHTEVSSQWVKALATGPEAVQLVEEYTGDTS